MLRGRDRYGSRRAGLASQGELFGEEEEDRVSGQFPDGDRKPSTEQGDAHSFHDVRTGSCADPDGDRASHDGQGLDVDVWRIRLPPAGGAASAGAGGAAGMGCVRSHARMRGESLDEFL